ncbi:MAG: CopG family transcriptional regulator [Planctomycetota bacterium]
MPDRNVTIVLAEEQIEALDLIAGEIGVSRSAIIRRAVVRYLPTVNKMVEESKPGNRAEELFYLLAGPPVKRTGDETDEQFIKALAAMRARLKAEPPKQRRKRAGRPRKETE